MNYKVIEEIRKRNIVLKIIQPDENDWRSRKYWLKAGIGYLELSSEELEDLEDVLKQLNNHPPPRKRFRLRRDKDGR